MTTAKTSGDFSLPATTDPRTWLTELARQSLGNVELTPEIDADLSRRAVAAKSDAAERNALLALLALKIERYSVRFRRWNIAPWEWNDVIQETYLAFADILADWQPLDGNGGPAGFGYYFVSVFPRRLSDRVNALVETRKRRGASVPLPWKPEADEREAPDAHDDIETQAILAAICGHLNAADATIIQLISTTDLDRNTIAHHAGVSHRTLYRRWPEIVSIARDVLRDAG